jgi:MraZ protein
MVLTGRYDRTLDDKLRVAIPKELREALQLPTPAILYIAPGTDGSLWLFREDEFARFGSRLADSSPTERHVRDFSRLFYAQAARLELDGQGRVRLSSEMVKRAELTKEVTLIGVQDHLELWDRARWESYFRSKAPEYDAIAEAAFAGVMRPPRAKPT